MSSKRSRQYEAVIAAAVTVLLQISGDVTTPRNVRRAAKEAVNVLQAKDHTPAVRASNAVNLLDEATQDPNLPSYTRTKLWNIITDLEVIKD